jgi:ABC-2 type transport system ATP-binding protein
MRQRLGIALALLNKPKLMLLDEPMNGLDPEGIVELRDLLIELNQKEGITVLISSHILSELEKIASCYGFISHGRILQEITAEELQRNCRKSINVKVADISLAEPVLTKLGIKEYKAYPNGDIQIFDNVAINDLIVAFNKDNVGVIGINSKEESVEDYYLNLMKEGKEYGTSH